MKIVADSVVSFHYRVATAEGEPVDQSEAGEPLVYLHGSGQIVPGLEQALLGHVAGEHVRVEVPPEAGYGKHDPALDLVVPMQAFPDEARDQIEPGFQFVAAHPADDDQDVMFTVVEVKGDKVVVTGNHELADRTLIFEVDIVAVRAATAEELEHGHVHGEGGHHH